MKRFFYTPFNMKIKPAMVLVDASSEHNPHM